MITGTNSETEKIAPQLLAIQQVCFAVPTDAGEFLQLGLDISLVKEVLPSLHIMPVPLAPEVVIGILDWRGRIIAALDLSLILRHRKTPESSRNRLLIIQKNDGPFAFLVSDVIGIVRTVGTLDPTPPEANLDSDLAIGSIRSTLGRVILLNLEAI